MIYKRRILCFVICFMLALCPLACTKDTNNKLTEKPKGPDHPVKEEEPVPPPFQDATFDNLGAQVFIKVLRAGTFVKSSAGTDYIYTVMEGEPGHLVGFETLTGRLVVDEPIGDSESSWDLTVSTDGYVYIAGEGKLYRHLPGSTLVENLGTVLSGQKMVWALAAGQDGVIYGATYPGCQVFMFDPKLQRFTTVGGSAPLVPGQDYAHSIVYHKGTNKLYVGTGIPARLIELDPVTGQKKQLLPPQYQNF